ncbi:MAG TPA: response regulator transcription factor [Candidatus Acidoferrum sp.]|nr:response regulator transcription factor [Candidatus Acidoferrum sp.]
MIRVFIVAASPLARSGLQQLLAHPDVEIVGSAVDLDTATGLLSEPVTEPDVIIVDATRDSGAVANLTGGPSDIAADIPVVVLEGSENGTASDLLRQGARAVLPAGVSPAELLAAVRAVFSGLIVLHPSTIAAIPHAAVNTSRAASEEWIEPLTKREKEVLQMLAAGLGNKEIAAKLNISDHTAKFHVGSILGKLGVSTRAEAVAMGIRRGLVLL